MTDFEYVVTKKAAPRICFGTGLEREVLPTKGPCMSPYMRRGIGEMRDNLGPGAYDSQRDAFYDLTHRVVEISFMVIGLISITITNSSTKISGQML